MLGKTGHGKSSTGNTILGERRFDSHGFNVTVTSACQTASKIFENRTITILDTPDTDINRTYLLRKEINDFCVEFPPSALLLILRWNTRMTQEEASIMKIVDEISYRKDLLDRTLLVFTHGDTFKPDVKGRSERRKLFRRHCEQQTGTLKDLLMRVGNRYILVNNMEESARRRMREAAEIVEAIDSMMVNASNLYVDEVSEDGFTTVSSRPLTQSSHSVLMYDLKEMHSSGWEYGLPGCFPARARVVLDSGKVTYLKTVEIGQKVMTMSSNGKCEFSEVYMFGHSDEMANEAFISVSTANNVLNVSPDHHVFIRRDRDLITIPARHIQIGMQVIHVKENGAEFQEDSVIDVATVADRGLYAPFTKSGTIVVDGVLASCYVDCVPPRVAHPLLWPVRMLYSVSPSLLTWISQSRTDGVPNWIRGIMTIVLKIKNICC